MPSGILVSGSSQPRLDIVDDMHLLAGLSFVADVLLHMSGWQVYATVAILALVESAVFVGMVLPGETAMVVAGVLAAHGNIRLPLILTFAATAAVLGDQIGFTIGRRFGPALRSSALGARVSSQRWDRANQLVTERGASAVFTARFVAVLRAVVPTAAGIVGMPWRRFLVANMLGGIAWSTMAVMAGYLAGGSVSTAQDLLSRMSVIGLCALSLTVVVCWGRRRRTARW